MLCSPMLFIEISINNTSIDLVVFFPKISDLVVILDINILQVDLTEYVEKHEFVFDAVLNEEVSNDEVRKFSS